MSKYSAISRRALSVPARIAFKKGIITSGMRVLDYGCGRGDDVYFLRQLDVAAYGWDPHWAPDPRRLTFKYEVALLTYVLNVIPSWDERLNVLEKALACAPTVVASVRPFHDVRRLEERMAESGSAAGCWPDGVITSRGFQFTKAPIVMWTTLNAESEVGMWAHSFNNHIALFRRK